MISVGWDYEGVAWYGINDGSVSSDPTVLTDLQKSRFSTLFEILEYRFTDMVKEYDYEYLLLNAYRLKNADPSVTLPFLVETGKAPSPVKLMYESIDVGDEAPYIRCRTSQMERFIKDVYGVDVKIPESEILYKTFINKDGYLTEWGSSWMMSYSGGYKIDNLSFYPQKDSLQIDVTEIVSDRIENPEGSTELKTTKWTRKKDSYYGYILNLQ